MRNTFVALALMAGMAGAGAVQAGSIDVHDVSCGFSSDYDVRVAPDGIDFRRESGHPGEIFMHEGRLRVDGHDLTVSAADAGRLRDYEAQVRGLLPEVAAIAREGLNIGYAAMRTVLATFAENEADRRAMLDRLDQNYRQAQTRIDESLGKGVWQSHEMDDVIETGIEQTVSDLVGKVAGAAVSAALSGDQAKVAALQARASSLDKTIRHEVDARATALNRRADALCPRLGSLQQLQQQLQLRLPDGSPLKLITYDGKDNKKLTTAAEHARAD
ncbi:DUF2884 family protein [Dyella solisilvae]|nr:DUF2884 family protein [Dyella solisilvae]